MLSSPFQHPNGKEKEYDIVDAGLSAVVVHVTENNTVNMVRVFRLGQNNVHMDFSGGYVAGEDPAIELILY